MMRREARSRCRHMELECSHEDTLAFDESLRQQLSMLVSAAQLDDGLVLECAVPGARLEQDHDSQQLTTCEHRGRVRLTPLTRDTTLEFVFEGARSNAAHTLQHAASSSHHISTSSAAPLATSPPSICVQSLINPARVAPALGMQADALAPASLPVACSSQLTTAGRAPSAHAFTFAANRLDLTPSKPWHAPSCRSEGSGPVQPTPPCSMASHRPFCGVAAGAANAPIRPHVRGPVQSAALPQPDSALGSTYSNGCPDAPVNWMRTTPSSQGLLLVQRCRSHSTGSLPEGLAPSVRTTVSSYRASAQQLSGQQSRPSAPPPSECSLGGCEGAPALGSMTMWDMLCGRFLSRVPGMDAFNERARPPRWAAWDPCSKHRSRCCFLTHLSGLAVTILPRQQYSKIPLWDTLCCLLVLYVALTLPVQMAFADSMSLTWLRGFDLAIDVLFLIDVYINLRTGYFSLDKESGIWSLELQGSKCAKHYLLRWAIVDVLSVLPFDLVWLAFSSLSYKVQLNIVRLPRCLKLLRLPRLFRYMKKWQGLIPVSSIMMQLATCVGVMLLFAHFAACMLVLAAKVEGLPEGSWMVVYELVERDTIVQYLYALFISTSHLFCLGYGLASMPGTFIEMCVTLVSMVFGSVLFLNVVGTLPTAVLEQEVNAAAHELNGDGVPLPTARPTHDRVRLASALGVLVGNNFRTSAMASGQAARTSVALAPGAEAVAQGACQWRRRSEDGHRRTSGQARSHDGSALRFRPRNSTIRESSNRSMSDDLNSMLTATTLALPGSGTSAYQPLRP